jgi:hypothetical protein
LGGSVTITITATINAGTPAGTSVSNQGTISFDANADGTNEATALTDDPGVGGASNPTVFTLAGAAAVAVPTTSELGLLFLGLGLMGAAWMTLRRRSRTC